jgi:hypothetical protein
MQTPLEKRLPVVAGSVIAIAAAAIIGGSIWLRILVLLAVLILWGVMLHYIFHLPWGRITRYKEPASETEGSGPAASRR